MLFVLFVYDGSLYVGQGVGMAFWWFVSIVGQGDLEVICICLGFFSIDSDTLTTA